jgi:hypothetical protein
MLKIPVLLAESPNIVENIAEVEDKPDPEQLKMF